MSILKASSFCWGWHRTGAGAKAWGGGVSSLGWGIGCKDRVCGRFLGGASCEWFEMSTSTASPSSPWITWTTPRDEVLLFSMLLYHVFFKANCPLKCVYCPVIFCRLSSYFLWTVQLFFVDCPVIFCGLSSYFLWTVQLLVVDNSVDN